MGELAAVSARALMGWRTAFRTLIDQGETGAVKVAFDLRSAS